MHLLFMEFKQAYDTFMIFMSYDDDITLSARSRKGKLYVKKKIMRV